MVNRGFSYQLALLVSLSAHALLFFVIPFPSVTPQLSFDLVEMVSLDSIESLLPQPPPLRPITQAAPPVAPPQTLEEETPVEDLQEAAPPEEEAPPPPEELSETPVEPPPEEVLSEETPLPPEEAPTTTPAPESIDTLSLEQILDHTQAAELIPPPVSEAPKPSKPIALPKEAEALLSELDLPYESPEGEELNRFLPHLSTHQALFYAQQLRALFEQSWLIPPLSEQGLFVIVRFRIHRDGTLKGYVIERRSSHALLDRSIENLLESLDSLPALPESYSHRYYEFGIRFSPDDFQ